MIEVGRRPVLVLWGTIVAERLGFERDEALTLGRAVASLGGHATNASLDVVTPAKLEEVRAKLHPGQITDIRLIDRVVSIARVPEGLRAVVKHQLVDPASVELYLGEKFGDNIDSVAEAMISLAETLSPSRLAECAFELYEQFRPETSELDIDRITASIRSDLRDGAFSNDEAPSESWLEDAQGELPSFRGPQALTGGATPSHRVEPMRRERTAYHVPARVADAPGARTRPRAIEPPASPRSISVSPVNRPMVGGVIPARRPTSPLVLMLAVVLAGAIGGGVSALLVAPPLRTSAMTELQGLFAFHRRTSSPSREMSEAEVMRAAAESDRRASAPDGDPIAVETSTPLAPAAAITLASSPVNGTPGSPPVDSVGAAISPPLAPTTAVVPPSGTVNGTPEDAPVDNIGASEVTRMEPGDEAARRESFAAEISSPVAPAAVVVPPSTTVNGTPADALVASNEASEVDRIEPSAEAAGSKPIAVRISAPVAPAAAVVPPSTAMNETPVDTPGASHDASEVGRIAMERGDERMRQGDVVAARRFYEMAAGAGSVQAATAMGRTFDPVYLGHIRVRGAFADPQRAKQWYEKGATAGDMEALARIELLTWNSSHR